ncbi:FecR family protein [Paenibacillus thermotolerans]|uniref:FecR family protein n=1 Tax=Paenibacillus thermotolerans TaxID=3027807 RepID=UPI002368C6D1|nr:MULTISPECIES: FecR family protein [unclassified Paenibacillus]
MALNQGDKLRTGKQSNVVLKVADRDDEITLGAEANVELNKLTSDAKGKQTNIALWAGSLFVTAGKLTGSDSFEVETPTAVMGIRGTQFIAGIDPLTNDTVVTVGSGIVTAKAGPAIAHNLKPAPSTYVFPMQQLQLGNGEGQGKLFKEVSFVDVEELVASSDAAILKAIVRNKKALDEENADFLKQLKAEKPPTWLSGIDLIDGKDIQLYESNLKRIGDVIAKEAVEQGKVGQAELAEIAKKGNAKLDVKAQDIVLSDKQEKKREEVKKKKEDRQELIMEEKKKEEESKQNAGKTDDRNGGSNSGKGGGSGNGGNSGGSGDNSGNGGGSGKGGNGGNIGGSGGNSGNGGGSGNGGNNGNSGGSSGNSGNGGSSGNGGNNGHSGGNSGNGGGKN